MLEKHMHDQLTDTGAVNVLRHAVFESALLGTGIKGPFNFYKRIHRWGKSENGERQYDPYEKIVPRLGGCIIMGFSP